MTAEDFTALALTLPGAATGSHFGKQDFRIEGGTIFASLPSQETANLKLTPDQQAMMVEMYGGLFSALPNAWGAKGWTALDLAACPEDVAHTALGYASANAAPKRRAR